MMFDAMTLGEAILRFSPSDQKRLVESEWFHLTLGGAELNVAAGMAQLGMKTAFLTKLPDSAIGEAVRRRLRMVNVSDEFVAKDLHEEARMPLYYYEPGSSPRKPMVLYDRKNSSFTHCCMEDFDSALKAGCRLFHTSGISLALHQQCCTTAVSLIEAIKKQGTLISFDVNYRAALWDEETARTQIEQVLSLTDLLFISEESCRRMFQKTGPLQKILRDFAGTYDLRYVASTQRKIISPLQHEFSALLYDAQRDCFVTEAPYQIDVIDRIGSGDAFVAGVLSAFLQGRPAEEMVGWGNAMAAIQCTVAADLPVTSVQELHKVIQQHAGLIPGDEMVR